MRADHAIAPALGAAVLFASLFPDAPVLVALNVFVLVFALAWRKHESRRRLKRYRKGGIFRA